MTHPFDRMFGAAVAVVDIGVGIVLYFQTSWTLETGLIFIMCLIVTWIGAYLEFEPVRYGTEIVAGAAQFFWHFAGALLGSVADIWRDLITLIKEATD